MFEDTKAYSGFSVEIMRGHGPDIAWFRDPAGNIPSVIKRDSGA